MEERLDYQHAAPKAIKAMYGLELYVRNSGLEHSLLELVKLRVSQINGCAFCIDMHWKDARAAGESEQRLYSLDAWRETPFYTDRERAALDWAETVTLVSQTHVPDEAFARVREHFSDEELVNLTTAIVAINGWNRFGVAFRPAPGVYKAQSA
jgi:AhpD family alkylhydroperoxidase